VSVFRLGVLGAAVVAGPPLYAAVQAGGLDGSSAIARGVAIGVACVIGVSYLAKIVANYDAESREARAALDRVIAEMITQEVPGHRAPAGDFARDAEGRAGDRTVPRQRAGDGEAAAAPTPDKPEGTPHADVRGTAAVSPPPG
jgi:hypothetical protein